MSNKKISEQFKGDYFIKNNSCGLCGCIYNKRIAYHMMNYQKGYKAIHDWVGKVIPWEMCKK